MSSSWSIADLDVHPKLISDFAVRTRTGAFVSIAAIAIAALLFLSELRFYLTTEKVEHMEVDDASAGGMRLGAAVGGKQLRINFDITFPDLPCAMVSLDAVDASGTHSMDVLHNIFKRRLDPTGVPVGEIQRSGELRTLKSTEDLLKEKQRAIAEGRPAVKVDEGVCGDCYGGGDAGQCCNTCEDVREVYRKKGWQFRMEGVSQCTKEGFVGDVTAQLAAVREGVWGGGGGSGCGSAGCPQCTHSAPLCLRALGSHLPSPILRAVRGLQRVRLAGGAQGAWVVSLCTWARHVVPGSC